MWAQYSEDHEGICIVFDKDLFENALKITGYKHIKEKEEYVKLSHQPFYISDIISYTSKLKFSLYHQIINYDNCYNNEDIYEDLYNYILFEKEPLLFQKHLDWSGEDEYRYVTFNSTSVGNMINIKDCLEEIHFGILTPGIVIEETYKNFIEKVDKVKFYKLIHYYGSYELLDYTDLLRKVVLINQLGEDKIKPLIFEHNLNLFLFDIEKYKINLDFINSFEKYNYCCDVLCKLLKLC